MFITWKKKCFPDGTKSKVTNYLCFFPNCIRSLEELPCALSSSSLTSYYYCTSKFLDIIVLWSQYSCGFVWKVKVKVAQSCPTLCDSIQSVDSPGQNTWVGSLSLLQGIFPTQGSNSGLLHCRQILYQLSHKGSLWFRLPAC